MEGIKTLCTILVGLIIAVSVYGAWMATFALPDKVGTLESSVSLITLAIAVWAAHACGHWRCDNSNSNSMKK